MIEVTFTPPCAEIMELLELSPELASCTVNEHDSAVISRCGSLATWYLHPNAGWTTDRRRYVFAPRYGPVGMSLLTIKQPDGTLVLRVAGPYARRLTFRQPLPTFDPRGMHVVASWDEGILKVHLNGKLAETRKVG